MDTGESNPMLQISKERNERHFPPSLLAFGAQLSSYSCANHLSRMEAEARSEENGGDEEEYRARDRQVKETESKG